MTRTFLALGSIASVAFVLSITSAAAHDAPSGWAYAPECCSGHDCKPVTDAAISSVPGGWRINATGEIFAQNRVRQSKDGQFHRCSVQGRIDAHTYCLYVPPMGM